MTWYYRLYYLRVTSNGRDVIVHMRRLISHMVEDGFSLDASNHFVADSWKEGMSF